MSKKRSKERGKQKLVYKEYWEPAKEKKPAKVSVPHVAIPEETVKREKRLDKFMKKRGEERRAREKSLERRAKAGTADLTSRNTDAIISERKKRGKKK